ncbi:MAG: hypothetical protein RLZZ468_1382, partial [Cyanobacteriota bacterium]
VEVMIKPFSRILVALIAAALLVSLLWWGGRSLLRLWHRSRSH